MPEPPGARGVLDADPVRSIAIIANGAFSIHNFRGPLIRSLVSAGVKVHALAPDYDDVSRATIRALGAEPIDISLDRTGMRPFRDLLDAGRIRLVLRRLRPDAVFSYFIKPVIFGSLAATLAGVPRRYALIAGLGYVYTPAGTAEAWRRRLLRWLASGLYRMALRTCHRVFFQNQDDLREFSEAGLVDPQRAVLLTGTGVDLDRFEPAPPVEAPVTFLFVGRLLREKGVYELVEAARKVRAANPEARVQLLGEVDPNPGSLTREAVAAWDAEGVVDWIGRVDDVRPWIARSSVFVLPSWREGKPRSTQEAMAMGRPIVTTDAPGCRDTVEQGVNGIIVPVRDPDALADAMMRFIREPRLIGTMGLESRRLAEERFDVHKINQVILREIGIEPARGRAAG
jgi:glycosyltransferase involved in cell wall biosynthesis